MLRLSNINNSSTFYNVQIIVIKFSLCYNINDTFFALSGEHLDVQKKYRCKVYYALADDPQSSGIAGVGRASRKNRKPPLLADWRRILSGQ